MTDVPQPQGDIPSEFLIYDAPDGNTRIEVRMQDEAVWLTQKKWRTCFRRASRPSA